MKKLKQKEQEEGKSLFALIVEARNKQLSKGHTPDEDRRQHTRGQLAGIAVRIIEGNIPQDVVHQNLINKYRDNQLSQEELFAHAIALMIAEYEAFGLGERAEGPSTGGLLQYIPNTVTEQLLNEQERAIVDTILDNENEGDNADDAIHIANVASDPTIPDEEYRQILNLFLIDISASYNNSTLRCVTMSRAINIRNHFRRLNGIAGRTSVEASMIGRRNTGAPRIRGMGDDRPVSFTFDDLALDNSEGGESEEPTEGGESREDRPF
jgi:hypothetical protein